MVTRNPHLDERIVREVYGGADPKERFIAKSNRRRYSPTSDYGDRTGGGEFQGWRSKETSPVYKENYFNYPANEFSGITSPNLLKNLTKIPNRGGFAGKGISYKDILAKNRTDALQEEETYSQRANRLWEAQKRYDTAQMLMNEPEARAMERDVATEWMDAGYDNPVVDIYRQPGWTTEAEGISPGFDNARTYGAPGKFQYQVAPGQQITPDLPYDWRAQKRYDTAQMLMNEPEARALERDVANEWMGYGYDNPVVDVMRRPGWMTEHPGVSPGFGNARTYSSPAEFAYSVDPEQEVIPDFKGTDHLPGWVLDPRTMPDETPHGAVDVTGEPVMRPERPRWDNWLGNLLRSIGGRNRGGLASLRYAR